MFHLPVSKLIVELRQFTGSEDVLLLESVGDELEVSLALAERSACCAGGGKLDAAALTVTDLEVLLLEQRRLLLGDEIQPQARCPVPDCSAAIDVSFRVSDYIAHHLPRPPRNVEPVNEEPGWFRFHEGQVEFRLVTARDLVAVKGERNPECALARRTIRPQGISRKEMKQAQQAMAVLAPLLSQELQGTCPECGATVHFFFNVQSYVQRELRYEAAFVFEDIHWLATRYHWSEEKILSLPRARRLQYAEMALRTGA